jgi:uncharacterized protein (DUF1501 family)
MLKRLTKRGVGTETFQAIDNLKKIDPATYQPENGDDYPKSRFGQSIREIAELIRSDIGLDVALLDSGGWDHHVNERAVQDQLANLLRDLGQGIAAFHQDMGDRMENVVFVSMSEFGRAAHENGNRGPDHANGMFVTGGPVKGGKDYGRRPGWMPPPLLSGARSSHEHRFPCRAQRDCRPPSWKSRCRVRFSRIHRQPRAITQFIMNLIQSDFRRPA